MSRRDFLATAGVLAAIGGWYRPSWAGDKVWVPPATRKPRVIENTWIEMPDGVKLAACASGRTVARCIAKHWSA